LKTGNKKFNLNIFVDTFEVDQYNSGVIVNIYDFKTIQITIKEEKK